MQSFVRKVVTHSQHSSFNSHHRIIFHKLPIPIPNPKPVFHSIPTSIRSFLSNPLITRLRPAPLSHCKPRAYFRRHTFHFNQTSNSFYRRAWRSWISRLTPNDVVLGLIGANVAIFLLWRVADQKFMINNFTISLDNIKSGRLHTVITNAFSHIETGHIISNMIGLYFFGMNIGRNFGTEFLLKLYFAGAVGGAVFYLVHQAYKAQTSKLSWRSKELALGASAAVNAIMLLDIFLFPKATLYLDFFIPVPAVLLGIYLIGKDMLMILEGDSRISGAAHLGGAVVAAIAWARVRKGRF
ncbi:hypothetical protein RIF29_07896 [Crotalaria pallida]|uniref:Peptidase S54 rhomboid domain-containing protein n=1 Tax=Crotalaria pallida TaxID=3830 RepID=A0AAN9PCB5_CROPI